MTPKRLKLAIEEARRFIAVAKLAQGNAADNPDYPYAPSKKTAAARRASMDLTRALSDMRRTWS